MLSAISLGVFCRVAPSTSRDHAIQKRLTGIGRNAHLDPVGEHLVPPVTAEGRRRLADDGGRFAGDGRLVPRGHTLDDLAIAGDVAVGLDVDHVTGAELTAGDLFKASVGGVALGNGFSLGFAQGVGLGLATTSAIASAKLAKSTVTHSQSVICRLKPSRPGG